MLPISLVKRRSNNKTNIDTRILEAKKNTKENN